MMKALRNEQGFTLIELMVVVLIIGILVAVAVPVFVNASNNAKVTTDKANLRTLDGAIQTYQADTQTDLTNAAGGLSLLVPQYVKAIPKCPLSASPYTMVDAVTGVSAAHAVSPVGTTY